MQPSAETTAIRVQHPAAGVAVLEFVTALAGAALGRDHPQRHARDRLAGDPFGENLAWGEQRRRSVQLTIFHARDQAAAPAAGDLGAQLRVGLADLCQGVEQHNVAQRLRHTQAQGARWRAIVGYQFTQ
ncbi:hypothetical protein D9M71_576140 [compost metagenome]